MKKLLVILVVSFIGCSQKDAVSKETVSSVIRNYYLFQVRGVRSIENLSVDSIVPVTEKKQLELALQSSEKKYNYFIEAKDDEFADSTAKEVERLQQKFKTANDRELLFFSVYHTISFTGRDMIRRKRQSNLDISRDYKIRPNQVTETDSREGIKGERFYEKPYSY